MFDSEPGRFRAWRARRKQKKEESQLRTWIAWIFVAVALGGGILVVLLPAEWFRSSPSSPVPAIVEMIPGPAQKVVNGCHLQEPIDAAVGDLTQAPRTNWVLLGKYATPEADEIGPFSSDKFRQCYARTPAGALFSAANFISVMENLSVPDRVSLFEARVSRDGEYANRVSLLKQIASNNAINASSDAPTVQQFAAYRWVSYTPDRASLQLVRKSEYGLISVDYTLVWQSNDWLMLTAPLTGRSFTLIPSLANYIPWSGTT